MNIKDKMTEMFGINKEKEDEIKVIDVEPDGTQLFKDDIINFVNDELTKRQQERVGIEGQWSMNANFLIGNQNCDINPNHENEIEQLTPVYDWLRRECFNNIAPLIETRVANLKKLNYLMRVKPATNELDDYSKAEVSTSILQYLQQKSDFNSKKDTMIYWNELCGSCFWLSWWDKNQGDKYAIEEKIRIDKNGIKSKEEKAYYSGDIDYGLITPYEVYPESIFKQTVEDQRSIILQQVKTVADVKDLYGIDVEGQTVDTFALTPVSSAGGLGIDNTVMSLTTRTVNDSVKVITYFERPSATRPNGRMIIVVGEDNLVYYGDLPYSEIPLIRVVCRDTPGQFFGKSTIEALIPLQRALNGCMNRIHEYIQRIGIGSFFVEEGSLVDIEEVQNNGLAPGAMLVYHNGTNIPTPVPNGNLPQEIMNERFNLKKDMEYVAGTSQLMVNGATPSGVTSGTAIANLMEIDNTRLSLTGDHIRNSVRKLAILWLHIYKQYATTSRIVQYVGTNDIAKALTWSNEDINSYDVIYTTENELLHSEEKQKEDFMQAYQAGWFADDEGRIPLRVKLRGLEYMHMGNLSEMMNINLLQMQAAQRENVFFENGAVPEVSEFDDHDIHIEEHLRYILQMDFKILKMKKPEWAEVMEAHIREHKAIKEQEEQEEQQRMMLNAMATKGLPNA